MASDSRLVCGPYRDDLRTGEEVAHEVCRWAQEHPEASEMFREIEELLSQEKVA